MNIVWFSWKDVKHPLAGGAEQVADAILTRLVRDGHTATLITARPAGSSKEDTVNGYKVIRRGSRFTVYLAAARYYRHHLRGQTDLVIDEVNTIPFFAHFYTRTKSAVFIHQLARQVWFFQMPFPLNWIGYVLEPLYLRLIARQPIITVSNSTRQDLIRHGFNGKKINIVRLGIELQPISNLSSVKKFNHPTILALGAVRPMKRTLDIVTAFNKAKDHIADLTLIIAGSDTDPYAQKVRRAISESPYADSISMLGAVSYAKKQNLMQRSHLQLVTSIKEGWGLIVTEANSQGTPVIAYDVDGLRDSVTPNVTGLVVPPDPQALGSAAASLLSDPKRYQRFRQAAWKDAQQHTYDATYSDFVDIISKY